MTAFREQIQTVNLSTQADFAAFIAAIGVNKYTGRWKGIAEITSNLTIPANIEFDFVNGGRFRILNGSRLTIEKGKDWAKNYIFEIEAGSKIEVLNIDFWRLEWFGDRTVATGQIARDRVVNSLPFYFGGYRVLEDDPKVKFIAHRGASDIAPENTLQAYEKAADLGFWGAECDVQLTSDNQWVLMHDDTVDRTTDGTGLVSSLTLAQIQALDAGSWKDALWAGAKVPTLLEFIQFCSLNKLTPFIEIKETGSYSDAQLQSLLTITKTAFPDYKFIILSLSDTILEQVRSIDQEVQLLYVSTTWFSTRVATCLSIGNCHFAVNIASFPADGSDLYRFGLQMGAWTVSDQEDVVNIVRLGATFVISNNLTEI